MPLLQRIGDWWGGRVPPLTGVEPTADEEAAFRRHCGDAASRGGPRFVLAMWVALLAWWPLDPLVFAGREGVIERFATWRLLLLGVLGVLWLGLPPRLIARYPVVTHALALWPSLLVTGWSLGGIDGFDGPWFFYLMVTPILSPLLLAPLPTRIGVTGLASVVTCAGFLAGAPPGSASHPELAPALSFLVFTTALGIFLGDLTYRLSRASFVRKLRIEAREASLVALKDALAARVAEQTRALRRLTQHLEQMRESERAWLARELHDELGQELTALRYGTVVARALAPADTPVAEALGQITRLLEQTTETTRRLLRGLRPRALDEVGLVSAVRWLTRTMSERGGPRVDFQARVGDEPIDPEVARAAFRIVQEALTNVERHAQATRVVVRLSRTDDAMCVEVTDDGVGLPPDPPAETGFGLLGIRERVLSLGGEAAFERPDPGGTRVLVRLPLGPSEEHHDSNPAG